MVEELLVDKYINRYFPCYLRGFEIDTEKIEISDNCITMFVYFFKLGFCFNIRAEILLPQR